MFFVIYSSSAVKPFTEKELLDLLEVSRSHNAELGITGLLLYKDGNFMQFLEGSRENVLSTLGKIKDDPRHRKLITLLQQEHPEREFAGWAMGFKVLESDTLPRIPGYTDFLNLPLTSDQYLLDPSKCLRHLLSFKRMVR
jgi:hypothetical protein